MKQKKRSIIPTIILILVFVIGLSLLLYPTVSDYWNSLHQSRAITGYTEQVADLDTETYEKLWAEAEAYNETLIYKTDRFLPDDEELEAYNSYLAVPGTNVIGYVEIDKINCYLPIYHGTDESVLQIGVGHLEGSSLPTGGKGTHCVISGHRGLPSSKLFTDLDQLEEGDTFVLYVLDRTLTYEVDQITVVEPTDVDDLAIDTGEDYCTLMTCTPYGINTHRLLVRGHRVENTTVTEDEPITPAVAEAEDTSQSELVNLIIPAVVVVLILIFITLLVLLRRRKRPRRYRQLRR